MLLLLGEAGARRDDANDEGIDGLLRKRGRDGMWKMVGGLNGKMHAALDPHG